MTVHSRTSLSSLAALAIAQGLAALSLAALTGCSDGSTSSPDSAADTPAAPAAPATRADALVDEQDLLHEGHDPAEATLVAPGRDGAPVVFTRDRLRPREERLRYTKSPPARGGSAPVEAPALSNKDKLLAAVASYAPDRMVEVLFSVEDAPFNWHALKSDEYQSEEKTRAALDVRRRQIESLTAPVRAKLARLGAESVETFLTTSAVAARVPAGRVAELARWPEVQGLVGEEQLGSEGELAYGGYEAKNGMRISTFASTIDGSTGSRASGRIRIGLIDGLKLNTTHTGFGRLGPSPFFLPYTTFKSTYDCYNNSPCATWSPTFTSGASGTYDHATVMARVIDGYISGGTLDAERKSGVIPRGNASIYFYGHNPESLSPAPSSSSVAGFMRGLDRAVIDQVDVVNVSRNFSGNPGDSPAYSTGCCAPCDTSCNCAGTANSSANGMNASIKNATDAGILIVKSSGNFGERLQADPSTTKRCLTTYPSWRKDVLTVGGLNSNPSAAYTQAYYDTSTTILSTGGGYGPNVQEGSSRGGADIFTSQFNAKAIAVVDLAAPAEYTHHYVDQNSYDSTTVLQGSSNSAASATGVAALLRQAAVGQSTYYSNWSGRKLLTAMLLLGDGYKYDGGTTLTGFDPRSGAGRIHAHHPGVAQLGYPSGWSMVGDSVVQGQTKSQFILPEGYYTPEELATITQVKIAMTFPEQSYTNAADLDLFVRWGCPGPYLGTAVASDMSYDIRSRVTLRPGDVPTHLRDMSCWKVEVTAYSTPGGPSGAAVPYNLSYYYHTENPANH